MTLIYSVLIYSTLEKLNPFIITLFWNTSLDCKKQPRLFLNHPCNWCLPRWKRFLFRFIRKCMTSIQFSSEPSMSSCLLMCPNFVKKDSSKRMWIRASAKQKNSFRKEKGISSAGWWKCNVASCKNITVVTQATGRRRKLLWMWYMKQSII